MDCDDAASRLPWMLNGTLDAGEAEQLRQHLEGCSRCREDLQETRQAAAVFSAHLPTSVLMDMAWDRPGAGLDAGLASRHLEHCPECSEELDLARQSRRVQEVPEAMPRPRRVGWSSWAALPASLAAGLVVGVWWGTTRAPVRPVLDDRRVPALESEVARLRESEKGLRAELESARGPADQLARLRALPRRPDPRSGGPRDQRGHGVAPAPARSRSSSAGRRRAPRPRSRSGTRKTRSSGAARASGRDRWVPRRWPFRARCFPTALTSSWCARPAGPPGPTRSASAPSAEGSAPVADELEGRPAVRVGRRRAGGSSRAAPRAAPRPWSGPPAGGRRSASSARRCCRRRPPTARPARCARPRTGRRGSGPSIPSPDISLPSAVPQAERVTRSASIRTCSKISQAWSRPLSRPGLPVAGAGRGRARSRAGRPRRPGRGRRSGRATPRAPTALARSSVASAPT